MHYTHLSLPQHTWSTILSSLSCPLYHCCPVVPISIYSGFVSHCISPSLHSCKFPTTYSFALRNDMLSHLYSHPCTLRVYALTHRYHLSFFLGPLLSHILHHFLSLHPALSLWFGQSCIFSTARHLFLPTPCHTLIPHYIVQSHLLQYNSHLSKDI